MKRKRWFLLASLALLLGGAGQWASASDPFQVGLSHYNNGRYREAVIFLSRAAMAHPASPVLHYHLGNALVKSGLHDQAIQEYELSYRLDPYSGVAQYCRMALKAYGRPSPELAQTHVAPDGSVQFATDPPPGPPIDRNLRIAKNTIRRQAEFEKSKHRATGEALAGLAMRHAERDVHRIREDMKEEMQRALEPPVMTLPTGRGVMTIPLPFDADLARARAEEVRQRAKEAERTVRKAAETRAERQKSFCKEREYALDEVVANLESQLEEPAGRSGVKLQSVGTDLYVRYYGYQRGSEQMPDIRQAAVRIVGDSASQGRLDSGGADSQQGPIRIQRRVRGKVLR